MLHPQDGQAVTDVGPAKAGASSDYGMAHNSSSKALWVPAFAGTTGRRFETGHDQRPFFL